VGRADVALFVRELMARPNGRDANVASIDSGAGLSNATIQQRLVPVRLFYDFPVEEGVRESNPVGRGRFVPGRRGGGNPRGLVPRHTKLPWIRPSWRTMGWSRPCSRMSATGVPNSAPSTGGIALSD
jgi:hypothetical protein